MKPGPRHPARRAPPPRGARRSRSSATPTPASRACSTRSPTPACWSRTRCSPPSTRRRAAGETADGRTYTLTDTVGFVRHLPHQLVEAFRSTLEEMAGADLLVHVVDASDALPEEQIEAVREVLVEIGGARDAMPPELLVVNKIDAAERPAARAAAPPAARRGVRLRATAATGSSGCASAIAELLPRPEVELEVAAAVHRGRARRPGARRGRGARRGAHRRGHRAARPCLGPELARARCRRHAGEPAPVP